MSRPLFPREGTLISQKKLFFRACCLLLKPFQLFLGSNQKVRLTSNPTDARASLSTSPQDLISRHTLENPIRIGSKMPSNRTGTTRTRGAPKDLSPSYSSSSPGPQQYSSHESHTHSVEPVQRSHLSGEWYQGSHQFNFIRSHSGVKALEDL